MPHEVSLIAADAVANLRSALDQACFAAAMASNPKGRGKDTYFPITDTVDQLEGARRS